MVRIRLQRLGAKKEAKFVVVVAEQRAARDGKFLEKVGLYFPKAKNEADRIQFKKDRIEHWVKSGAQMSLTVSQLLAASK
jgi:small subunit ribosomal protein S16